jgi:glycosyltransferase involved in cell wall biosynthesis
LKILLYTDLTIRTDQLFWHRDLGLLTQSFRSLGHEALLCVHPSPDSPSKINPLNLSIQEDPVLWVSHQDVHNPIWWQSHKPDLVILGLWTRPKYDSIRRASLSATPHVIERADSDGMRTASCGFLPYAKRRFDYFRDRTYHWPVPLSTPASILYSFASILATPWIEARLAHTLNLLPVVAVETPHATTLWKRLASRLGADPKKIHCIPHPIQTNIFKPDPTIPKKNQVISVGRWESHQKNLPLLLKTLHAFLDKNPSWNSLIIGSGLPAKSPHSRMTFLPPTDSTHLARLMQESKIFLSSSRYESFGLASAEALACGTLVVAPEATMLHSALQENPARSVSLLSRLSLASQSTPAGRPEIPGTTFSGLAVAQTFLTISGT